MAFANKEGFGGIFVNNKKKAPNHPDRQGSALFEGIEIDIAGWVKYDKDGNPWLSITLKRKSDSPKGNGGQQRERRTEPDFF